MLDPVTGKYLDTIVVHSDRNTDDEGPLRILQPFAQICIQAHHFGCLVELCDGEPEGGRIQFMQRGHRRHLYAVAATGCPSAAVVLKPSEMRTVHSSRKTAENSLAMCSSTCGMETGAPKLTSSDVTRHPSRPQGTMLENGRRSFATLSAKPCQVIPRSILAPIDAIFAWPFRSLSHMPGFLATR